VRRSEPFLEARVLTEKHAVVDVRLQLPFVDGVRLRDVDEHPVRQRSNPSVQPFDVARPATKRRSGEAAEDEQ
jgi:hypothetical protein